MKIRYFLLFVLIGIFFYQTCPGKAYAQENPPNSPAEFIIQKVIHKIAENEMAKKSLTYKRVHTIENLDDKEQVTDVEKNETTLIEAGGRESVIELNGRQVNRKKSNPPDFDLVKVFEAIAKLDEFQIVNLEMINNRPYYVISFKARSDAKPKGDIEDVIVRSEGSIYIDIEKFYIKKLVARLVRNYERCWGCFNLMRADMVMEQEEFEDIVVMKSITIIDKFYAIKNLGVTFERKTYLYKDYEKRH